MPLLLAAVHQPVPLQLAAERAAETPLQPVPLLADQLVPLLAVLATSLPVTSVTSE